MRAPGEVLGVNENPCVDELRRAYRALARRWHPDRFLAGPERDWAGEKMAEINAAYRVLIRTARAKDLADEEKLARAREMIEDGRYSTARELLMEMPTRCAEWNFLFRRAAHEAFRLQQGAHISLRGGAPEAGFGQVRQGGVRRARVGRPEEAHIWTVKKYGMRRASRVFCAMNQKRRILASLASALLIAGLILCMLLRPARTKADEVVFAGDARIGRPIRMGRERAGACL